MNLAILIAISRYDHVHDLPGCRQDAVNMKQLLQACGKYECILEVTQGTQARQIWETLSQFVRKHLAQDIHEVMLYFSGHGYYRGDARFCGSDFQASQSQTTSIGNVEIDLLLRSLKPRVLVKIIDACQSGMPYIKGEKDSFKQALAHSVLPSFISMASSQCDQPSYVNQEGSDFTLQWIQAVLCQPSGPIYYSHIGSWLACAFEDNTAQTPFFVSQGHGREMLCEMNDALRKLRERSAQRPTKALRAKAHRRVGLAQNTPHGDKAMDLSFKTDVLGRHAGL